MELEASNDEMMKAREKLKKKMGSIQRNILTIMYQKSTNLFIMENFQWQNIWQVK